MDISNGPGIRISVFTQGCNIHCPECFNKVAWDIDGGKEWSDEETNLILKLLDNPHVDGITWLGGEPTLWASAIASINREIKLKFPDKTIWLYSGHTINELREFSETRDLLETIDVLVDGPFISDLKISGEFRGSSNQNIIHL
jgi:anaerobic ribonucleoside-triphosphate reductase activating protein